MSFFISEDFITSQGRSLNPGNASKNRPIRHSVQVIFRRNGEIKAGLFRIGNSYVRTDPEDPDREERLVFHGSEQVDSHFYHAPVFLVGGGRILHLEEGCAGQLGTVAAVLIATFVHCAVVKRANLGWHHLHCPEGGAFDVAASGACFVIELAFIAFESAGA